MPRVSEAQIEAARFKTFETAASFNAAVRDFADSVPENLLVPLHKKLHLKALRGIVQKTPVDTGRARGNWQSTVGTPATGEIGQPGGPSLGEFTRAPSLSVAGQEAIDAGLRAMSGLQPFAVSYIVNNLPYIEKLEAGSSEQAETPAGMVAVTITELETQFR